MEMHIVHRKQSYGSVQEALKHSDGLSVLAFFFQVSTFLTLVQFTDIFALCQVITPMSVKVGRGAVYFGRCASTFRHILQLKSGKPATLTTQGSRYFLKVVTKLRLQSVTPRKTLVTAVGTSNLGRINLFYSKKNPTKTELKCPFPRKF